MVDKVRLNEAIDAEVLDKASDMLILVYPLKLALMGRKGMEDPV